MKRTIVTTSICSHCNKESETTLHVLWYYEKITSVWRRAFGVLNFVFYSLTSFADLLDLVSTSNFSPDLFVRICWFISQKRNKAQVHEPILPLAYIPATTRDNLREFQRLQLKPHDTSRPMREVWKPPNTNTRKTDFDGAMFEELNIIMPPSVVILETITARRVVHLIHELGLHSDKGVLVCSMTQGSRLSLWTHQLPISKRRSKATTP